jgi:hypothetical protein
VLVAHTGLLLFKLVFTPLLMRMIVSLTLAYCAFYFTVNNEKLLF